MPNQLAMCDQCKAYMQLAIHLAVIDPLLPIAIFLVLLRQPDRLTSIAIVS